ncbi:MAG: NADH-quinone oxidoreductase subunit L, partial [Betaproteobacteria bacterium]
MPIPALYLIVPLAPLAGALIAGLWGTRLFGNRLPRAGAHWVTILGVAVSFVASVIIYFDVMRGNVFNGPVYTWLESGAVTM